MFDRPYSFEFSCNKYPNENKFQKRIHTFKFTTDKNIRYLVHVEEFDYNIFIIKFHRKHDHGESKYHLLTNEFRCSRIISTCIQIILTIYSNNNMASFGFVGSNTMTAKVSEIKIETKRFRFYRAVMTSFVGEDRFVHYEDKYLSRYLMINTQNPSTETVLRKAIEMFDEIYP